MSSRTRSGLGVFRLVYNPCGKSRTDGQINKQLMKVPARILPAPSVMYARNQDARPTDGSWNLRGKEVSYFLLNFSVKKQADISSSEMVKPPSKHGR